MVTDLAAPRLIAQPWGGAWQGYALPAAALDITTNTTTPQTLNSDTTYTVFNGVTMDISGVTNSTVTVTGIAPVTFINHGTILNHSAVGGTAALVAPRPSVGTAPVGIAPMLAGSPSVASARPVTMPAQPLAARGNTNVSLSAPITVNVPPGMDAREIAALIESRLRALVRETTRSPAAAMYD